MPFKSKAQRRKFAQLLVEGKITDEQYEEWNRSTGGKELPERVGGTGTAKRATPGRTPKKRPARTQAAKSRPAKSRPAQSRPAQSRPAKKRPAKKRKTSKGSERRRRSSAPSR